MDKRSKQILEKILWYEVLFMRFITSWYISPIWVFGLGMLFGQPIWFCLIMALAFGYLSYKIWREPLDC